MSVLQQPMQPLRRPPVRWSQTGDLVRIVIDVPDLAHVDATLSEGGRRLHLAGGGGALDTALDLFAAADCLLGAVQAEQLSAVVVLKKQDPGAKPWPRLTSGPHAAAPAAIFCDWSRYDPEPGEDYDDDDIMSVKLK